MRIIGWLNNGSFGGNGGMFVCYMASLRGCVGGGLPVVGILGGGEG